MTKAFYDEYFAVLDLTAEFYLETVRLIFQEHALPMGKLEWRGHRVDPSAIRKTMLFTVEGERDDICAVGRPSRRTICAASCGLTSSATTCKPVSTIMGSSQESAGRIRFIRS